MTHAEKVLATVLLDIWPRCHVCGCRAEYRPIAEPGGSWWCEAHRPSEYGERNTRTERALGFEAVLELQRMRSFEGV